MTFRITLTSLALGAALLANPSFADDSCSYQGTMYSHGSAVCQAGSQYRCNNGQWKGLGVGCPASPPSAAKDCTYDGQSFSAGSASCQSGSQYRCDDGAWRSLGVTCRQPADGSEAQVGQPDRTCMFNGATVSNRSSICKMGVTFRCDQGEWVNLGTACR